MLKSPVLKKCVRPGCDNYFYSIVRKKKYCCKKCQIKDANERHKEYRKEWRRNNRLKNKIGGI